MTKPFTMRGARKRYRMEKASRTDHGEAFRPWARRTYNASGAAGKLRDVVRSVRR